MDGTRLKSDELLFRDLDNRELFFVSFLTSRTYVLFETKLFYFSLRFLFFFLVTLFFPPFKQLALLDQNVINIITFDRLFNYIVENLCREFFCNCDDH